MSEKFSLKWNDYQQNSVQSFSSLRAESVFTDVTLVGDDHQQISSHKVVLSSCSEYFKNILIQNTHSHPMLCFDNVNANDLNQILDYVYLGEVQLYQEQLDRFLMLAQRFKIKGLLDNPVNHSDNENMNPKQETYEELNDSINYERKSIKDTKKSSDDLSIVNTGPITAGSSIAELDRRISELLGRNEDGNYICKMCEKIGNSRKDNMKNHIETHLVGISFPCEICGKKFRSRNSLFVHNTRNHR